MNNVNLFFNTKIEGSGALAAIGDFGLTPVRYLFNGKTIRITSSYPGENTVHHVPSFHQRGNLNSSTSLSSLKSSSKNNMKTFVAVVCLIPGLVLSVFKLIAYSFDSVKERHSLVKEHFTPINLEIGSASSPIETWYDLNYELMNKPSRPINALIIHGDGKLKIKSDPGILSRNPMKVILVGAEIVRESEDSLADQMIDSGKWIQANAHITSVDGALAFKAHVRTPFGGKLYHLLFNLNSPQIPGTL